MKIGIVLSSTPGYSETFFMSKIKGLQKHGHEVILFTQTAHKDFKRCEVRKSLPVYKRKLVHQAYWFVLFILKFITHPVPFIRFIWFENKEGKAVLSIFKRLYSSAHILTAKLDWLHFGFATMALGKEHLAKSIGAKMAVSLRGFDIAIYPIKFPNCYNLLWDKVDRVHTISNDLLVLAHQNGLETHTPYQKITPAIDIDEFNSKTAVKKYSNVLKIITVARLHWKKGLTDTLRAMKILKDQGLNFQYSIVGDGPEYEKLSYLIHALELEKEVVLIGKVSHQEVKEILEVHEIYVQFSISEGFCNAVLEAQAMGLLCVVSDAEGLPENVIDSKTGWVVPKRDAYRLAETIQKVSRMNNDQKLRIRQKAIDRVRDEFNLEKQQKDFIKFYDLDEKTT